MEEIKKGIDVLIDFDNTVLAGNFPDVHTDIGAVPVLKRLVAKGHRLILFTGRSDKFDKVITDGLPNVTPVNGAFLTEAIEWFKNHDIPLYGIQRHPLQDGFTSSPKAYGDLMIDDTSLNAPTKIDLSISKKPFIDWELAERLLEERGIL